MPREVEYHFSTGSDFDQDLLEQKADNNGYDIEMTQYEERKGVSISGTQADVNDLLSEDTEAEGRAPVRTMLGVQYNEKEELPEDNRQPIAAD
jgi:hypothetical protein